MEVSYCHKIVCKCMQLILVKRINGCALIASILQSNEDELIVNWSFYLFFRIQGSISLGDGEWMISARAKNTEGWSEDGFAQHTKIILPKGN